MKLRTGLFSLFAFPLLLVSCESTNRRRAGGGAFDDTPMGKNLDGSAIVPDTEDLAKESFEAWRQLDE